MELTINGVEVAEAMGCCIIIINTIPDNLSHKSPYLHVLYWPNMHNREHHSVAILSHQCTLHTALELEMLKTCLASSSHDRQGVHCSLPLLVARAPSHLLNSRSNSRRPTQVVWNRCNIETDIADHSVRSDFSKWTSAIGDAVPVIWVVLSQLTAAFTTFVTLSDHSKADG